MSARLLRIATRQSPLALWQAHFVREQLLKYWPELNIELRPMTTSGDKVLNKKLIEAGGKGLFVKELEEAILDDRADLAVHSMKDVPAAFPEGLSLTTICTRENPFDAFVSQTHPHLDTLPKRSVIGTSSLRRQSQLLAYRPDLEVKTLRGNVQTRLKKLDTGEFDAIILAVAGLDRLGLQARICDILHETIMLPACGQGAIGIECRNDDETLHHLLSPLNDPLSALCVHTERQVNAELGGNCHVPLAVYCKPLSDSTLLLRAKVASPDGRTILNSSQQGHHKEASMLAQQCVQQLLSAGAHALLSGHSL